jgi:hypothetical protein
VQLRRLLGNIASRFYLESNLALIDSSVSLGDSADFLTNAERPLQGQSPWTVNFTLGYENLIARSKASLLFNMNGARISSVGTQGLPDAYEQPTPTLDAVYKKEFYQGHEEKLDFGVKASNLLDPTFEVTRGGKVEKRYRKGISLSASLSYKWK